MSSLLLAAVLCIALPPATHAGEVVGRGDFEFFLDMAAFRHSDGSTWEELYFRVANPELRFKQENGRLANHSKFAVRIKDDAGKTFVSDEFELDFDADSEQETKSPVRFQTIIKKYRLPEGREVAEIATLNNNYLFRKVQAIAGVSLSYPDTQRRIEQVRYSWEELARDTGVSLDELCSARQLSFGKPGLGILCLSR